MEQAVIISLNFNPGHVSHLIASYKQCEELGYKSVLYINKRFVDFLPSNIEFKVYGNKAHLKNIKIALFLFPSIHNLFVIIKLKYKFKPRIFYFFHEPLEPLIYYYKAGFSLFKLLKISIIDMVNVLTVFISTDIILPSKKALQLYKSNRLYRNNKFHYLPLLYDDENQLSLRKNKKYFSYIGTIAADHSFNEYLNFIETCIKGNVFIGKLDFLIATKTSLPQNSRLQILCESGRLTVIEGKPLTNEEINLCYSESYIIWNAYIRTTQSGVLAKAFMFGVPAIVLKKNISEFVHPYKDVVAIESNVNYNEIVNAINEILANYSVYEKAARNNFLSNFYYRHFNKSFSKMINSNI